MKKQVLLTLGMIGIFTIASCSKEDSNPPEDNQNDSILVSNLHAPQDTDYTQNPPVASGPFVKFDFSTGAITTSETDWDIAFRGTSILVNGAAVAGLSMPLSVTAMRAPISSMVFLMKSAVSIPVPLLKTALMD